MTNQLTDPVSGPTRTAAKPEITIEDLKRILLESAGADESVDLDGDVLDVEFAELGYDSLALLETAAVIARQYGITLDDETAAGARTPRELLAAVNEVNEVDPA